MKLIIVFIMLMCACSFGFAQDLAVRSNTIPGYRLLESGNYTYPNKKQHCNATIGGEGCLVGGAGMILIGAAIPQPAHPVQGSSQGVIPDVLVVLGALIVAEGVVSFTAGEIYDHFHNRRYSVISKHNQVGLAYNF